MIPRPCSKAFPNDATHVMRVEAPRRQAQRIADLISETFDPAEVAVANFERTDDDWVVEVYAGSAFDPDMLRELVEMAAGSELAAAVKFGEIEERTGSPRVWRPRPGVRRPGGGARRA